MSVLLTQVYTASIQEQRSQGDALEKYLDDTSTLALGDMGIEVIGGPAQTTAEVRTLAFLQGADPDHKRLALQFLYGQKLITPYARDTTRSVREGRYVADRNNIDKSGQPIISLNTADLSVVDLTGMDLRDADLRGVKLSGAIVHRS